MKATDWEFKNRALLFGMILAWTFPLYFLDHQNATVAIANWLAPMPRMDAERIVRALFAGAAFLLGCAALLRTWASSYLRADVVYASEVKSEALVADGPYRWVRNPLYLANVLMALGLGSMMSRAGWVVAALAMPAFCQRLILREEAELQASQGKSYEDYRKAVPRLWPSLTPRVASSGRRAQWSEGFKAEFWYWGFPASVAAFAVTLNQKFFFIILGASILAFWAASTALRKSAARAL